MALSYVAQPGYELSGNTIPLVVSSDNYVVNAGSISYFDITWTDAIAADDWIQIEWGENVVLMTAKLTPDDTGYQYTTYAGLLFDTGDNVLDDFLANYLLNRDFEITSIADGLRFTQRVAAQITVVRTDNDANINTGSSTFGSDPELAANFNVLCRIRLEDDVDSGDLIDLPLLHAWVDNGEFKFDLSKSLAAYLPILELDWNEGAPVEYTNALKEYYTELCEYFGDPPTYQKVYFGGVFRVLRGAFNHYDHTRYLFGLAVDLLQTKKWLTSRADNREVTQAQQVYLAWYDHAILNPGDYLVLAAEVFYDDNTSTETIVDDMDDVAQSKVGVVPAGYLQCELDALEPTKTATHYQIWIRSYDTGTEYANRRTFQLVDESYLSLYFEYINAWGYPDSVHCKGGYTEGVEMTVEQVWKDISFSYTESETSHGSDPREMQDVLECTTGYLPKEELLDFVEFLFSERVWWMDTDNQRKVGGVIPSDKYVLVRRGGDNENAYALNFKFLRDEPEQAHSRFLL